jgi:pimeloyl-ACP methyl ester carboxylesterase
MVYKWPPSTPTRLGGSCDLAAAGTVPVKWVSSALLAAATTNALVPGKSLLRLASFGRLILTDLLGTGSSDAVLIHDRPAMQAWTDGLVAVLDAVGSECVSVFAMSESALPVILLTASGQIVSRFAQALGRASGGLGGLLFRLGRWAVRRTPRSPDRGASCCQVQPLSD